MRNIIYKASVPHLCTSCNVLYNFCQFHMKLLLSMLLYMRHLRDLVLFNFGQFKKLEKRPWRSDTFKTVTLLKVTFLHGCFSCFLNFTNGTKLRKASHNVKIQSISWLLTGIMKGLILSRFILLYMLHNIMISTCLNPYHNFHKKIQVDSFLTSTNKLLIS